MDSQTYWKNRETEQRKHNIRDEAEYQKHIQEIYQNMIDEIEKEINGFYGKYASKEGITLAEAKKRAAKADIEALGRKAAKYVKDKNFSDQANEEMRLYNMTMKVNRLELLKAQIGLEMVAGFDEMEKYFGEILTERAVSEFERQAGILGMTIQNNAKAANAIVNASFHNATYSDRIWMYQDMLKNELSSLLQTGLIQGQNPRRLATHLRKRFGVSQSNAERLMTTELRRVQTEAARQSYEANGNVEYRFLAINPMGACSICRALDGKVFKVEKMMPGTNAPPMHPRCHCATAPYWDEAAFNAWLEADTDMEFAEWNKLKKTGKSVAKGSGSGIIKSQKKSVYEGIPRSWKKIEGPDDSLRAVNPNYSSRDKAYATNCTNCVPAYEMRKRGYNVTARPTTKNHYLSRHPEEAWIDAKVKNTSGNGLDDIIDTIGKWPDGARAEVAITWKGSRNGHVIVAENVNGKIRFYDVQSGEKISSKLFSYVEEGKTTFWRIDNLELSDRGITACKAGD